MNPHSQLPGSLHGLLSTGLATNSSSIGTEIRPGLRLLEKLGEGGIGEVFLAEETIPLRRMIAVKRLRRAGEREDGQNWFAREHEALARLDHPNIARVFEGGIDPEGHPYYAMELVDGPPLPQFCTRGGLGIAARLQLFVTICHAIQHAHQRGVLHADLKPSNVLVAVDETGAAQPKLIDFGATGPARRHFGTPGYAGPEQYSGLRAPDPRSDVHALGVILRELLVSADERMPPEAEWIIARATSAIPEQRYPSAVELAGDVQNLLENRPLSAAPAGSVGYRLRKFVQRNRRSLAADAVLGATVVALGVTFQAQQKRAWAAERSVRASRHQMELERTRNAVAAHLANVDHLLTTGSYDQAEQELQTTDAFVTMLPPEDATWRRDAKRAWVRLFLIQRQHAEAEPILRDLASVPPDDPDGWEPRLELVRLYLQSRRFEDAAVASETVLTELKTHMPRSHPVYLRAIHLSGRVAVERFQYGEAHVALQEAAAGFRKHFGPDAAETRQVLGDLAEVEQVLRDQERLPPR